jgi:hypothetical protein
MRHFFQRVARHGVIGTIKLLPTNLRNVARTLSPSAIAARRRDRDFDRRHSTITSGFIPLGALGISGQSVAHGNAYEPIPPGRFDEMMRVLPSDLSDFIFIDYGSGRGRALLLASYYPFKEIIGIEFSQRLHQDAVLNLQKYRPPERVCYNSKSLLLDATQFVPPPDPTIVLFNNPFDREIMSVVLQRIESAHRSQQSPIYVLYAYPEQEDLLSSSAFWVKLGSGHLWSVFGRSSSFLHPGDSD